jgi:hypothetical protein
MAVSTILDGIRTLFHKEKSIDAVLAQAVSALLKLVIVHDTHQRMQQRGTHIPGIVIDTLDMEDLFHSTNIGNFAHFP